MHPLPPSALRNAANDLVHGLTQVARAVWALVTLDLAALERARVVFERPRVVRGIIAALIVVHVLQCVDAARKESGALRRSYLLGERFRSRMDPAGYEVRLAAWVANPSAASPPCLEIEQLVRLEDDVRELEAKPARNARELKDLTEARTDLIAARTWLAAEQRRAYWAARRSELDQRRARGEPVAPGALEAAERASLVCEPDGVHRPYPLSFALLMWPCSYVALLPLRIVWYLGQLALLAAMWWIVSRASAGWYPGWSRRAGWIALLVWLVLLRYLQRDVDGGQVNLVQAGLCVLAVWWNGRRRYVAAGTALGLAISIKLTPLLMAAWLLGRGYWRTFAVAMLVFAALLFAPLGLLGERVFWLNTTYWLDGVRQMEGADPFAQGTVIVDFDFANQSLRNMVHRYMRIYPRDRADRPARGYVDFADESFASAETVTLGAEIAIVLAVVLVCGLRPPHPSSLVYWVEVSFVLVLMLLLSPITWKAHFVLLIVPLHLLIAFAIARRDTMIWACLIGFTVVAALPSRSVLGRDGEDLHLAYYGHTIGLFFIFLALIGMRLRLRRLPPSEEGLPEA